MAGGRRGGRAKRRKVCYFTSNGITQKTLYRYGGTSNDACTL